MERFQVESNRLHQLAQAVPGQISWDSLYHGIERGETVYKIVTFDVDSDADPVIVFTGLYQPCEYFLLGVLAHHKHA